jgi:hypothetical protein
MVRISKKAEKRSISPRKPKLAQEKTGSKKDNLPQGFKPVETACSGETAKKIFIPKIK